jgi:hypothetical protein
MISGNPDNLTNVFQQYIFRWFELLANGNWADALAMLDKPNCYGMIWTEDQIKKAISEHVGLGQRGDITPPSELPNLVREEPLAFDDGSGYAFDQDVPLNGEWSDLTAQFEFFRQPGGYAASLHALHML